MLCIQIYRVLQWKISHGRNRTRGLVINWGHFQFRVGYRKRHSDTTGCYIYLHSAIFIFIQTGYVMTAAATTSLCTSQAARIWNIAISLTRDVIGQGSIPAMRFFFHCKTLYLCIQAFESDVENQELKS
jgi:hypothetical protein